MVMAAAAGDIERAAGIGSPHGEVVREVACGLDGEGAAGVGEPQGSIAAGMGAAAVGAAATAGGIAGAGGGRPQGSDEVEVVVTPESQSSSFFAVAEGALTELHGSLAGATALVPAAPPPKEISNN